MGGRSGPATLQHSGDERTVSRETVSAPASHMLGKVLTGSMIAAWGRRGRIRVNPAQLWTSIAWAPISPRTRFAPIHSVLPAEVQELAQRACPDGKMRRLPDLVSAAVRGVRRGIAGPLTSEDQASDPGVPHAITPPTGLTARRVPFESGPVDARPIHARVGVSRETRRAYEVRIAVGSSFAKHQVGLRQKWDIGRNVTLGNPLAKASFTEPVHYYAVHGKPHVSRETSLRRRADPTGSPTCVQVCRELRLLHR